MDAFEDYRARSHKHVIVDPHFTYGLASSNDLVEICVHDRHIPRDSAIATNRDRPYASDLSA